MLSLCHTCALAMVVKNNNVKILIKKFIILFFNATNIIIYWFGCLYFILVFRKKCNFVLCRTLKTEDITQW